ncbi:MAG TPA: hypothetical protein VMV68_08020, partial [Spirochaetia bacterium]|nr:hypothetical protein [Spirochaetia bacterium]
GEVLFVTRITSGGPAAFGRETLIEQLKAKKIQIVERAHWRAAGQDSETAAKQANNNGTSDRMEQTVLIAGTVADPFVRRLLEERSIEARPEAEGIITARCHLGGGAEALVIAGTDEKGLMYGLVEAADRVEAQGLAGLDSFHDEVEYPEHRIRGVYQFVMGHLDRTWYDSEDFWRYYFARLARNRFNRFVLVLGFDTGYLSPPYPFFVETAKFPGVRAAGLSSDDVKRNVGHLNRIIDLAHSHGIEFILGTWQQAPRQKEEEVLVENLPRDETELADYCAEGLKALLTALPTLDGIHFRVNHEAGIGNQQSNEDFWRTMVTAVADVRPDIKLELRAKGLTGSMIGDALRTGLRVIVPTKYWCEHAGLPHHLTQMREEEPTQLENFNHSRRYSYADMLRRPRPYDVVYRLWNNGTTSVLLWSDPDYVRRFIASCHLGAAAGYEVSAPLALRWGHSRLQKEAWPLFADPKLRTGEWDDERYWLFYTLFGRMGYDRRADDEVLSREIARRYPVDAIPSLREAYGASGKILPLVTAFHMPVHPQQSYWPELSTGGALFPENNHRKYLYMNKEMSYATSEPSDPGLFYRIADWAEDSLAGSFKPKYSPLQVREWLSEFSRSTRAAVEKLDTMPEMAEIREHAAARIDFLILADIALFHAEKVQASVDLCLHDKTGEIALLESSLRAMERALAAWRKLSERGARAYHENLVFQAGVMSGERMGHWKDRLPEVEADVARLKRLLEAKDSEQRSMAASISENRRADAAIASPTSEVSSARARIPEHALANVEIPVELLLDPLTRGRGAWTLHYRHTNQLEGPFREATMVETSFGYRGVIPAEFVTDDFDILVYFATVEANGRARIFPGLYNAEHPMPYLVIEVR